MEPGQLIDELAATRHSFSYMGPTGPTPATQAQQLCPAGPVRTACNEDIIPDLTTQKPLPRAVPYQPPSYILTSAAEMTRHMALHYDVLGRIHTILK